MPRTFALIVTACFAVWASFAIAADAATMLKDQPRLAMGSKPSGGSGKMCGGIAAIQCTNAGDYCAYEEGACRTIADAAGTCKAKPEVCTMIYAPVCGCDGKTYSSECVAAGQGVSVAAKGECKA